MIEYSFNKVTSQDIELLIRRFAKGGRDGHIDFTQFRNSLTPVL